MFLSLLLNVPYSQKDIVKLLGAKLNPILKKWYVDNKSDYYLFRRWFNNKNANMIICDNLYIAVGLNKCFKCKLNTMVVAFAASHYVLLDGDSGEYNEDINFISDSEIIPQKLQKYLEDNYKYYKGYSKTTNTYYYGNHCSNCGVLQGNWFLHNEPDSPFFIDSEECAKKLFLYDIKLQNDLEFDGSISWGSGDYLIKEHSTIKKLDIELYKSSDTVSQLCATMLLLTI